MATPTMKPDKQSEPAVHLSLTAEEGDTLRLALESYLADFSTEIAGTDAYELREALKERRARTREVLRRLSATLAVAAGGEHATEAR